jgi:hypothetical protein
MPVAGKVEETAKVTRLKRRRRGSLEIAIFFAEYSARST